MEPEEFLEDGEVKVWEDRYDVVKARKTNPEAFTNIQDGNEITVIIEQDKYDEENAIEVEEDWRILTFNMVLPFELIGFLAKVAQILADEGISIFAVSAYSTDHILIKDEDLEPALDKLKSLGCIIEK